MAEKEYIEREAAYPIAQKIVNAITNGEYHAGVFAYDIMDWIDDIPAADVVEVVRCKDCRYFHNGYDEKCCINHKGVVVTDENGFCHHAERRADNG